MSFYRPARDLRARFSGNRMSRSLRRSSRRKGLVACLGGCLLVASCASSPPFVIAEFDPRPDGAAEDMGVDGELAIENGCLVVQVDGADPIVPIFARATASAHVQDNEPVLVLGETEHTMGQTVSFGGSLLAAVEGREEFAVPSACQLSLQFWVVNPGQGSAPQLPN